MTEYYWYDEKTNAMRLLDKLNIDYEVIEYKVNPDDLSAEHVSQDTGILWIGFLKRWLHMEKIPEI